MDAYVPSNSDSEADGIKPAQNDQKLDELKVAEVAIDFNINPRPPEIKKA